MYAVRELNLSDDAMMAVEMEAIEIALHGDVQDNIDAEYDTQHYFPREGPAFTPAPDIANGRPGTVTPPPPPSRNFEVDGYIWHSQDDLLRRDIPLANLRVRFYLGSFYRDSATNNGGWFTSNGDVYPSSSIVVFFENKYWKISVKANPATLTYWTGVIEQNLVDSNTVHLRLSDTLYPLFETHRAVNFYFYGNHNIPVQYNYREDNPYVMEQLKITVSSDRNINIANDEPGDSPAVFLYNNGFEISNYYRYRKDNGIDVMYSDNNFTLCTAFHELGHWTMWCLKGCDYSWYQNTYQIIRESWASYVGWELGESYYATQGIHRTPATSVSRLGYIGLQIRRLHRPISTHMAKNSYKSQL